jgi:hypothetical protein
LEVGSGSGRQNAAVDAGASVEGKVFEDYILTEPTLKELFMNVVTEA